MAEGISATVCTEEKMLAEESSQSNSSVPNKDSDEFIVEFDPRPQRPLKLNRRGFFLLNREEKETSIESSPGTVNPCKQNNFKKPEVSHDRLNSPLPGKKIIKLTSKNSASETQNGLKRSSNNTSINGMDQPPQESPPKKKHKPITWP